MIGKYEYEKQTGDCSKLETSKESAIRREFNGICKLIENIYDRYGVLEERISPILYTGPFPEGEGTDKCAPECSVRFAEELSTQKERLSSLVDRINNTIKRVEI